MSVQYTYLFASEADRLPVGYFRKLKKKYLKAVLRDLRRTANYVYVLLENLPETHFAIIRAEDYRHQVGAVKHWNGDESYSLRQFLHHSGLFHPKDIFRVRFCDEVFYYESGFTPQALEGLYRQCLKLFCEQGLRKNSPICLTHALIREYRLTRADAKIVRQHIEDSNAAASEKIQAEYNALKSLNCIDK